MKFGKQMAQMVALSDAEWAPFWISYKALKKRIKELQLQAPRHRGGGGGGGAGAGATGEGATDGADSEDCGGGKCCAEEEPTPKDLACRAGEVSK